MRFLDREGSPSQHSASLHPSCWTWDSVPPNAVRINPSPCGLFGQKTSSSFHAAKRNHVLSPNPRKKPGMKSFTPSQQSWSCLHGVAQNTPCAWFPAGNWDGGTWRGWNVPRTGALGSWDAEDNPKVLLSPWIRAQPCSPRGLQAFSLWNSWLLEALGQDGAAGVVTELIQSPLGIHPEGITLTQIL